LVFLSLLLYLKLNIITTLLYHHNSQTSHKMPLRHHNAPYNMVNGHQLKTSDRPSISGYWRVTGHGTYYNAWKHTHPNIRHRPTYKGLYKAMRPDKEGHWITNHLFKNPEEAAECVRMYCLEHDIDY